MTLTDTPTFPPLLRGEETPPGTDPFAKAVASAALGTDPGLICWTRDEATLRAALVLAPEAPLAQAVGIAFAVSLGMGDALGALSPAEIPVNYVWPGGFKLNGADCGVMRLAATTNDPQAEPDWLVIGVEIPYLPPSDDPSSGIEPGFDPDRTSLVEEGCLEVTPLKLLESWSRHTLTWINRWLDDGFQPLHAAWLERAWGVGEELPDGSGTFMGLDERGGMLVRTSKTTELRPLTAMLEDLS
jgi:BirA family biotin operon repressor/biotin-[acetyl-CoA-carboxylase] ligase